VTVAADADPKRVAAWVHFAAFRISAEKCWHSGRRGYHSDVSVLNPAFKPGLAADPVSFASIVQTGGEDT
jgi:hypothetical protein